MWTHFIGNVYESSSTRSSPEKKGNEQQIPKTCDLHVPSTWCPNLTKEICKQQLNRSYSVNSLTLSFAFLNNYCEVIYEMFHILNCAFLKSSKLWSSQLWTQFKQLHIEAWKSQDFNGIWTRDLAIPVRCSNQWSYEATDVGSWLVVSSNEPVKNGCEVIYEMFHILNCGFLKSSKLWSSQLWTQFKQ